jgi:hypothetical protein
MRLSFTHLYKIYYNKQRNYLTGYSVHLFLK